MSHVAFQSLKAWIDHLAKPLGQDICFELSRITSVWQRLDSSYRPKQIITVTGTNGKGSTCQFIEQGILSQGFSCSLFSSPFFISPTEQFRTNQQTITESQLTSALNHIEQVRCWSPAVLLTEFEIMTLAALYWFQQQQSDYWVLEVGFGGRNDAVNVISPDLAVITTIDVDHQAFLGEGREAIGFEKVGICRPNGKLITGERELPVSVVQELNRDIVELSQIDDDFQWQLKGQDYCWRASGQSRLLLFHQQLHPDNLAVAMQVLTELSLLPSQQQLQALLDQFNMAGRCQQVSVSPALYVDVAHNPQAGAYLASWLKQQQRQPSQVHLVVGMLADKDSAATLAFFAQQELADNWYLASLPDARGQSADNLAKQLMPSQPAQLFDSVTEALNAAVNNAESNDMILAFGSFRTVAAVMQWSN